MLTKSASMSALSSLMPLSPDIRGSDVCVEGQHGTRTKISSMSQLHSSAQQLSRFPSLDILPSRNAFKNSVGMEYKSLNVSSLFIRRVHSETDLRSLSHSVPLVESTNNFMCMGELTRALVDKQSVCSPYSKYFRSFEAEMRVRKCQSANFSTKQSLSTFSRRHVDIEALDSVIFPNLSSRRGSSLFSDYHVPCIGSLLMPPKSPSVVDLLCMSFQSEAHSRSSSSAIVLFKDLSPSEDMMEPCSGFRQVDTDNSHFHPRFSPTLTSNAPSDHCRPRAVKEASSLSTSVFNLPSPASSTHAFCHVSECECNYVQSFSGARENPSPSGLSVRNSPFLCVSGAREGVGHRGDERYGSAQQLGGGLGGGMAGGKGGKGAGGSHDWEESSQGNTDSSGADAYYRRALDKDPGHPLLLRNYARFLFEIQRDLLRAEEYYERAILANPGDGEVLAQYAKLIWEAHKDNVRAGNYFEQAIQAAPGDCYVLAGYASFLWSADSSNDGKCTDGNHCAC